MTLQTAQHFSMQIGIDRDAFHVFYCRYDNIDEQQLLDQYHNLLSHADQQRWQSIRTENGKRCFLVSRAMIRNLLSLATGCPASELTTAADIHGKPFIDKPTTRWQFNLSHSHGRIILALAYETDVGVDIECHYRKNDILPLARHFFHPREIRQLEALSGDVQRQHFFRVWTLKEAYLKALGIGLSRRLDSFGFTFQPSSSKLSMHPSPQSILNCWQGQAEPGYTFANIFLSHTPETRLLKLYDYLPHRHCTPRQINTLTHHIVSPE